MKNILVVVAALVTLAKAALALDVAEVKGPGGTSAWLVENHNNPLIAISFAFDGGTALDPAGKEGTVNLLTSLLDEGAGNLSGIQYQAERDRNAIKMRFSADGNRFYGSLQTLSRNREKAFGLLQLALTSASLSPDAVDRMRQQVLVQAQAAEQDPASIASRTLAVRFAGNYAALRPDGGTPASLHNVTREDLVSVRDRIFTRQNLKISAVGDISAGELQNMLATVFAGLPEKTEAKAEAPIKLAMGPQLAVIQRDMPQTYLLFALPGISRSDSGYFAAQVMNSILGGDSTSSWLNQDVREKAGLTYGIGFDLYPFKDSGVSLGAFSTMNDKAGAAMALVRQAMQRMITEGPTSQQLEDAKTYLTGSYALRFDTNTNIAGTLLAQQLAGRSSDFSEKRNALISAVTLEDVREQARRLLDPARLLVVAVGNPSGLQ